MQLSKVPLVICALALGTTLVIRAEDTPAQAAARAALASKLFELSSQEPATNAPTMPMPAPAPAPAMAADTMSNGVSAWAPMPQDPKAQAKAEKAAKAAAKAKVKADAAKAAADLKAQKAAAKKAADQKAADIAAAKKQVKANMETTKAVEAPPVTVSETDNAAQAKAREALTNTALDSAVTPAPTAPAAPDMAATKPGTAAETPAMPMPAKASFPATPFAVGAPPLPISGDQQQKLADLLMKYKADQITPDEYQKQRAAILGGQ